MSESNAELIAEAITRAELCDADSREAMRDTGRIIMRLADALEAADLLAETVGEQRDELSRMHRECHEQRDQLAAVIEQTEDFVTRHYLDTRFGDEVLPLLTAPTDALREHDAALIEELADEVHATLSDPNRKRPRDPRGEFATDLLNDVAWAVHLIREKARQRREGQS